MNDSVKLYEPVKVKTIRGAIVNVWGDADGEIGDLDFTESGLGIPVDGMPLSVTTLKETITADVQPKSLSEYELAAWGMNDMPSDAKVLYYHGSSVNLKKGNRAKVNDDIIYEVRAAIVWPRHSEAVLTPVQGIGNGT